MVEQFSEEGEAASDLTNPHVLYRKVIQYVASADQLSALSKEVTKFASICEIKRNMKVEVFPSKCSDLANNIL